MRLTRWLRVSFRLAVLSLRSSAESIAQRTFNAKMTKASLLAVVVASFVALSAPGIAAATANGSAQPRLTVYRFIGPGRGFVKAGSTAVTQGSVVPFDSGDQCSQEVCIHIYGPNNSTYVTAINVWNRYGDYPDGDYPAEILYPGTGGSTNWPGGTFFVNPGDYGIHVVYNTNLPSGQYCGYLYATAGLPCAGVHP